MEDRDGVDEREEIFLEERRWVFSFQKIRLFIKSRDRPKSGCGGGVSPK